MRNYAPIHRTMNAVIYYSNTGESQKIAEALAQYTQYALLDLTNVTQHAFDNAMLVFPVHCQNIPVTVKAFLKNLTATNLAVIATYGKMSFGNVLFEVQKLWRGNIVAAAYVPTKHSYLEDDSFADVDKLNVLADKLCVPTPIKVPRFHKNLFANFFPAGRSRAGVKLYATDSCNGCNKCAEVCNNNAITCGKPNGKCIRCLKCVRHCPQHALVFSLRLPMRRYLKRTNNNRLLIYV